MKRNTWISSSLQEEFIIKKPGCAFYQGTSRKDGKEMRVNCVSSKELYSEVEILSQKKKGFKIAEVEIHALGEWEISS